MSLEERVKVFNDLRLQKEDGDCAEVLTLHAEPHKASLHMLGLFNTHQQRQWYRLSAQLRIGRKRISNPWRIFGND